MTTSSEPPLYRVILSEGQPGEPLRHLEVALGDYDSCRQFVRELMEQRAQQLTRSHDAAMDFVSINIKIRERNPQGHLKEHQDQHWILARDIRRLRLMPAGSEHINTLRHRLLDIPFNPIGLSPYDP